MKRRDYGQYCGLARAMELVGERWALLIVRDLSVRPRRYTDLLDGLSGIPTNVLSTRLKELEAGGIVERRVAPSPQRGVLYALTAAGIDLEPALMALGRWGATQLDEPSPDDIVTAESVTMSLRAAFNPAAAAGLTASWQIDLRAFTLHALVVDGKLSAGVGEALGGPDLILTYEQDDLPSYRALMQAAKCGLLGLKGQRALLQTFIRVFSVGESVPLAQEAAVL
jgi:DNA-binding HxlR family transcriptional regulator